MLDDPSDRTRADPRSAPPRAEPVATPVHALPAGTALDEFDIRAVIGEGGFSVVYEAWDRSLHRLVAIKEYAPFDVATRNAAFDVVPRSSRHRESFEEGIRRFMEEARLLGRFDHPALVKVHRVWEARGTAYLAMPRYQGPTLKQAVRARATPVDQRWLTALVVPLFDALAALHAAGCVHRDVAPDNILLVGEAQAPVLLDFGAARVIDAERTQVLTAVLKEGYAPLEQYGEQASLRQGPWTDVYALAATLHWAIVGRTPPSAVSRMIQDRYQPLAQREAPGFERRFLEGIDRALALQPDRRTRSVAAFARSLGIDDPGEATIRRPVVARDASSAPRFAFGRRHGVLLAGGIAGVVALGGAATAWFIGGASGPAVGPVPTAAVAPAPVTAVAPPPLDTTTSKPVASPPAPVTSLAERPAAPPVGPARDGLQSAVDALARFGRDERQDVARPLRVAAAAAEAANRADLAGDADKAIGLYRGATAEVTRERVARTGVLVARYRHLAAEATDARQFDIAQQALDHARGLAASIAP